MYKIFSLLLLSGCVFFLSCDNFDDVEEEFPEFRIDPELIEARLTATWRADRVVYDLVEVTSEFQGFELTFDENNTWAATEGDPLFLSAGDWQFVEDRTDAVDFGNGIIAFISFPVDDTQVMMTMSVLTNGASIGGRNTGLSEEYIIDFSRVN